VHTLAKIIWYVSGPHFKKIVFYFSPQVPYLWRLYGIKIIKIEEIKNLTLGHLERDSVTRFSTSSFFHESVSPNIHLFRVSPKPLSILLGPFQIFSKIRRNICSSRCATGVVDTGGKREKSSIIEVLIILFGHL
jgi:hypothetical protein